MCKGQCRAMHCFEAPRSSGSTPTSISNGFGDTDVAALSVEASGFDKQALANVKPVHKRLSSTHTTLLLP